MRRLEGRVAIVTGGGSGIGAATARRLSFEGARVVCADTNLTGAQGVAAEVAGAAVEHDVADRASWEALMATVGGVDILVNNAGVTRDRSLLKMTDEEWHTVIDIHLKGMWLGCQHVVPSMRERGGGAIVNLSSEARHGAFGQANYSAAKAGIVGLTRTVAIEHARHGVRCNAIAPGAVDTPMTQAVPQEVKDTWIPNIPLRRFAEPSEIAAVIAFLVSDDASYVTGQCLGVDGRTRMELDDVQRDLQAMAHEFAEREMRPLAAEYDESEEFPWPVVRKAAEVGLTCYDLPEEYGGGGVDSLVTSVAIIEELAWGCSAMAGCIGGGGFFAGPIVALGTPQQKERWLPPLCSPTDPVVGALATTEPNAGSDAAAMVTSAVKVDGGYVLNGQKTWISCAPTADQYIVFAQTVPGSRSRGITAFLLLRGDEGFEIGKKIPKMGARCYPAAELFFHDCFVADDRRVGDEGQGFYGLMRWFDVSRVTLGANGVGIGRAALEYAVSYAREREQFGKKIHEFQAVSFRLVDAKMKLDQARLLTYHAARLADEGKPFAVEAAQAKLAGSEAAWFATWAASMTLGGYSYSREYPVERWLRAAKLEELYEGTSDIQRLIIGRSMFK